MKLRADAVQELINEFGGSIWEESGDHPVEDWERLVINDETRLGYWEHVAKELMHPDIRIRTSDVQGLINRYGGSLWNVDPMVSIADWKAEVRVGKTRLGYWEYSLQKRPRPWALKNPCGVSPDQMFWNGNSVSANIWCDLQSALRVADDEIPGVITHNLLNKIPGAQWFNVPLAQLMQSADPIDAMTLDLKAFVMRHELPHMSADDLLALEDVDHIQRLYLVQFVQQWEEVMEMTSESDHCDSPEDETEVSEIATVHLDIRVDYELNGESVGNMAANLRSSIEREIGNGALTGATDAMVDEYSMEVIDSPAELEELAAMRMVKKGFDPLMAKAIARYGMMSPTDFIESIAGSAALLRREEG